MMKSELEALHSRGYVEDYDFEAFNSLDKVQLFKLLHDRDPVKRSAAVRVISQRYGVKDQDISDMLLQQLSIEQKLYTRLEICTALEKGNETTARQMITYIGKIGSNQHKTIPECPSFKKSYPLPRDIIARSLGRMDHRIMSVLIEALNTGEPGQIPEILDAIGYLAFYKEAAAPKSYMNIVIKTIMENRDNPLIVWKGILCLSGFPFEESIDYLQDIVKQRENELFALEAQRAMKLMLMKSPFLQIVD